MCKGILKKNESDVVFNVLSWLTYKPYLLIIAYCTPPTGADNLCGCDLCVWGDELSSWKSSLTYSTESQVSLRELSERLESVESLHSG